MLLTLQLYLLFGTESEVHTIRQLIRIISGKEIKHHLVAQWGLKFQVHQKPTTIYNTKCNMTKIRLLNKGYLVWEHHSKRRLVLKWYLNSSHFDCCLNTFTYTIKTTYQLNSRIFKSPLYLRKKLGRKKKKIVNTSHWSRKRRQRLVAQGGVVVFRRSKKIRSEKT